MKLFKKLGTYFSMLTLVLSGASFNTIASEGEEGAEAFEDPNSDESANAEESSGSAEAGTGSAAAGAVQARAASSTFVRSNPASAAACPSLCGGAGCLVAL